MEEPFSKITIADICAKAHISRKTFYSYFVDKNDLLARTIYDDALHLIDDLRALLPTKNYKSAPKLLIETLHQSIYEQKDFFEKLIAHGEHYVLLSTLSTEISKMNRRILASSDLPAIEREYMAYFYASAHSMLILKWIQDKWRITPKQMTDYFYKWALQFWSESTDFSTFIKTKTHSPKGQLR